MAAASESGGDVLMDCSGCDCWEDDQAVVRAEEEDTWTRPIVVGYAFGPKKMSTMGVVMAEASKAKLTAAASSTAAATTATATATLVTYPSTASEPQLEETPGEQKSFVFTMDLLNGKESSSSSSGGLQNIVRHFRSSCSSVGSVSTAVTANSTLTTKTRASGKSFASSGRFGTNSNSTKIPVRVSFVPLDPGKVKQPLLASVYSTVHHVEEPRSHLIFILYNRCSARRSARRQNRYHLAQTH